MSSPLPSIAPDVVPSPRAKAPAPERFRSTAGGVSPLTLDQRERWLAARLDPPDAPARIEAWVVELSPDIRPEDLGRAVHALGERHPGLSLRIQPDGSGAVAGAAVLHLASRETPPADVDLRTWVAEQARDDLDPENGALVLFWWIRGHGGFNPRLVVVAHELTGGEPVMRAVLQDLADVYTRLRQGEPLAAPLAQPQGHDAEDLAAVARAYWRHKLSDRPDPLDLPLDRVRPATPSFTSVMAQRELPPHVLEGVHGLAVGEGVAVADVLVAGWTALLHRLTGMSAVTVGVAVEGPEGARLRPLYSRAEAALTWRAHVDATARERQNISRFARADLGGIIRELRWPRDPARPWWFDATVAIQPAVPRLVLGGSGEAPVTHVPPLHLDADLALTLRPTADAMALELRGNRDVLTAETLARWLGHFATLLESAIVSPDRPLDRLPLLTGPELQAIIAGWNPASRPTLSGPAVLHRLVSVAAQRHQRHPAIIAPDQTLTYAQLEAEANRLAHHLGALGAGPGARVGLLLDRSAAYAVATLAALKAGAAFVPIDPEWPEDRQAFVLRNCEAAVLVLAGRSAPRDLPSAVQVVDLATARETLDALPSAAPRVDVQPSDLAYVIYTSGSTGQPKGVMVDHRAVATHMASIAHVYRIGHDDRCLLFHSVAFDPAIEQLYSALVAGATVHVRGEGLWTGREFSAFVRSEGVTAVTLPPRYWLQLMRDWEQEPSLAPTGVLRRVLVGGEALPPAVVDLWRRLGLTSIRLLNGYGPTECTVTATVHELPAQPAANEACGRLPIGRPQGPVEAYVLDAHLQPQPVGVPGELCLAGPTLARGYLGRDELTAGRFVAHPFQAGARLYRTGDRARWLADGTIDFCGREDRQVKIGGYRIEPGEIETILGRCAGVSACAVVAEPDARGEAMLCGYFVPERSVAVEEESLREELLAVLPRYMVPAELIAVPELPRTINGKLDAAELARMGAAVRAARAEVEGKAGADSPPAERDELESRVAAIWCEALGRPEVRPQDNFFDVGGHSLLAIAVHSRLERECGVQLALRDWLVDASFAALVALVREARRARSTDASTAESTGRWRFLFPIQTAGTRPRLFLFAGGRGCDEDFVALAALTRALAPDQPVWGARIGGPDRLQPMHADAWEMAADVAREIREFQPKGPYHVAGECIGGLVAVEVARLLEAEGEDVAFLGLINTGCPRFAEPFRWWLRRVWIGRVKQAMRIVWRGLRNSPWSEAPHHVRTAFNHLMNPPRKKRPPRNDGLPDDPKDYHYGKMILRYRPAKTPVKFTLFGCETFLRDANVRRWSRYAGDGVSFVPIPGDHVTCIREHAAGTAARLREALPGDASTAPAATATASA